MPPRGQVRLAALPPGLAEALRRGDATADGTIRPGDGWPTDATIAALELGLADRLVLEGGLVVGECGVKAVDASGAAELGWGIAAPARGRGVGSALVRLLVDDALARPGVTAVEAQVDPGNHASLGAARAAGLRPVRTLDGHMLLRFPSPGAYSPPR